MEANTQGRRPTGPGWYWYDGPIVFGHITFVDTTGHITGYAPEINQPVEYDGETCDITGFGVIHPDAMPGDFVPLAKPVAAPEPGE